MDRRPFDIGAYGKPKPRSAAKPDASIRACAPLADGSNAFGSRRGEIISETYLITGSQVEKNVPSIQPHATQNAAQVITSAPSPTRPEQELSNKLRRPPEPSQPNLAPTVLVKETPSDLGDPSATALVEQDQIAKPHPFPTTVSTPKQLLAVKDTSVLKSCTLRTNESSKDLEVSNITQSPVDRLLDPDARSPQVDTTARAMYSQKKSGQNAAKGDRMKLLQAAQADSLHQISRKVAVRHGKHANDSVSIRDLDLARTPVDPDNPQKSFRKWAHDSPLYAGGYGEGAVAFSCIQKELSVAPQAPSTLASQALAETLTSLDSIDARRSKWAMKDEMKAEKMEAGSNDWGSQIASDATKGSNVSDKSFGKLLRSQEPAKDETLVDWEGNMLPPPADWAERPRYNNNNADFKKQFKDYVGQLEVRYSSGLSLKPPDEKIVGNVHYHPDGIGLIPRSRTVNVTNANHYGYSVAAGEDLEDVMLRYAQPLSEDIFEAEYKLDPNDEGNASHDPDETTDSLVRNWNMHLANARGESIHIGTVHDDIATAHVDNEVGPTFAAPIRDSSSAQTSEDALDAEFTPLVVPKLNVYLRPATIADLPELTRIYNWYVNHGSQPSELREIDEGAMESRRQFCSESKLPFIVAALKSQKNAKRIPIVDSEETSRRRQLPVTHQQPKALSRIENLAGFCCANDFSQPDFVEHIAADIEIYVDAQYRRMDVGKCLMDKMLHICDRGHRLTMEVPFHCDQDIRHMYEAGGRRDLHKLIFTLRKWHVPKPFTIDIQAKRKSRKLPLTKTQENDYTRWLKGWLESFGFEEEGYLKKMGAKNGRYIDIVYLGRVTSWQPADGKVPNPRDEFMNAYEVEDNDGDW